MVNKFFSIPADFRMETLDMLADINCQYPLAKVSECYGQVTNNYIRASGRDVSTLPEVDMRTLEAYVAYCNKVGIVFNYTLNPSCMGNLEFTSTGRKYFSNFLIDLHSIGISDLTIALPSLFELVDMAPVKFNVKASAICEIDTPYKVWYYRKLGAKRVVLDPDTYRDFEVLGDIAGTDDGELEVIVNNVCRRHCPYKHFHYSHDSHTADRDGAIVDFYVNRCHIQKSGEFTTTMKLNWIRPEDLDLYTDLSIRYFKIQGRQNILGADIKQVLDAYMSGSFDGNLFDLITLFSPYNAFQITIDNKRLEGFADKFADKTIRCRDRCAECGHCHIYAMKAINADEANKKNKQCLSFYTHYDSFKNAGYPSQPEMVRHDFNWGDMYD